MSKCSWKTKQINLHLNIFNRFKTNRIQNIRGPIGFSTDGAVASSRPTPFTFKIRGRCDRKVVFRFSTSPPPPPHPTREIKRTLVTRRARRGMITMSGPTHTLASTQTHENRTLVIGRSFFGLVGMLCVHCTPPRFRPKAARED